MPIYEFACPRCRKIYSFLARASPTGRTPACPNCGAKNLAKQMSAFAMPRGGKEAGAEGEPDGGGPMPDLDDPRLGRAMAEMERDMAHMDENNPRHLAQLMRKMQGLMPPGSALKELDAAIKRLEAGEDPEKIEADMGEVLSGFMGGEDEASGGGSAGYAKDGGLYDY